MEQGRLVVWLKGAAVVTMLAGCAALAASSPVGQWLWLTLFDLLTWPLDGLPEGFTSQGHALNAMVGGVLLGWGTTMFVLVDGYGARPARSPRRAMLSGVLVWFAADCAGSLVAGFPGNVALNVAFLLMWVPPLLLLGPSPGTEPAD